MMHVGAAVVAVPGLAIVSYAEVVDAVGMVMVAILMRMMMGMRLITVVVHMHDGLREGACWSRKAQAESRSHGKSQRQCPQ